MQSQLAKSRIITAIIVAALVLLTSTACLPRTTVPGKLRPTPAPIGELHTMVAIASTTVLGRQTPLRIHAFGDVTIADGEHGVGYPARIIENTGTPLFTWHYRSGSNPTRFVVVVNLLAKDITRMSDHLQIILKCSLHRDGEMILNYDEGSHVWQTITVSQARNGAVTSIGVACIWTDRE